MILITGVTGTIGGEVARQLAATGERVRAMARDPARADVPVGIEVVRADFDDASSLEHAVDGAGAVFLATAPGPAVPRHDTAMLAAARAADVAKIVKLSAIGTTVAGEPDGPDGRGQVKVGTWHRPGEEAIRASGATWTVLRPSDYASNTLRWAQAVRAGTPVANMTGTGAQGVVDPSDVAAVAAAVLTSPAWDGRVLTLTGPEALSVPDQARLLSRALGRPVETVDIPLDVARPQMLDSGMDPAFVEVAIDGRAFVAAGRNATVTDHVEQVLGRPPHTFAAWAADHRHAFTA